MSIEYETHQKVLREFVLKTDKPILELGAGDSSTRQIHEWCTNYILTVDDNRMWLERYSDLEGSRHGFMMLYELEEDKLYLDFNWGLVFIDLSTQELRKQAVLKYKSADYLVIHDGNYMFRDSFTREEFSDIFRYWKEFDELFPTTVVASNKFEI
jgi:hypothetical protein